MPWHNSNEDGSWLTSWFKKEPKIAPAILRIEPKTFHILQAYIKVLIDRKLLKGAFLFWLVVIKALFFYRNG